MTISLIAAAVLLVGVGTLLSIWKVGRTVIVESLTHPLTKSVIHVRADGEVAIERTGSHQETAEVEPDVKKQPHPVS